MFRFFNVLCRIVIRPVHVQEIKISAVLGPVTLHAALAGAGVTISQSSRANVQPKEGGGMAAAPLPYPPRSSRRREGGGWQRLPSLPLTDPAEGGRGEGGGGGQQQCWDGGDGEPTTTMTAVVDVVPLTPRNRGARCHPPLPATDLVIDFCSCRELNDCRLDLEAVATEDACDEEDKMVVAP
uniref:Uncharacterized protein n=1 Tax=Oryza sativa subsp. japonica TaxID=39947 RepID=Q6H597_ORYSJ|nr:hypothetical protein [Oryza sativa Japonica Group]